MVYNPYQSYQPQLPYNPYLQQMQQQSNNNTITWVQGEAGAKAYPVGAGTNALLMDSEAEKFYIKSTDASGMPQPLRKFQYKEIKENQPQEVPPVAQSFDGSQFITRDEFEKRMEELKRSRNTEYRKKEEVKNG